MWGAISGLIIALGSYAFLYTLDPRLVEFKELVVKPIDIYTQTSNWCKDNPDKVGSHDLKYFDITNENPSGKGTPKDSTLCGTEYQFGYLQNGDFKKQPSSCMEAHCPKQEQACVNIGASTPFCVNAKDFCEGTQKTECSGADKLIREVRELSQLAYSCASVDYEWLHGDKCVYDQIIVCPGNSTRVPCITGPSLSDDNKKEGRCWILNGDVRNPKQTTELTKYALFAFYPTCVDYDKVPYPNKVGGMICCLDNQNSNPVYTLVGASTPGSLLTCNSVDMVRSRCGMYTNRDACNLDICKVKEMLGDICSWNGTSCVKK